MASETSGWIKLFREVRSHWIWDDPLKFQWWVDILMEVNHSDKKVSIGFQLFECKRGQSLNSIQTWGKRWRVDESTVRRFFKQLIDDGMIETESLKKTTRLTVCNYDSYNESKRDTQGQDKSDASQTQVRDNTNKNDKNEKKEENGERVSSPLSFILEVTNAEELLLNNQLRFENICMAAGRSLTDAKLSLRKFHLYLEEKGQYPKTKKAVFAGFEKWLLNEKNFDQGKDKTGSEKLTAQDYQEWAHAELRKKYEAESIPGYRTPKTTV